MFSEIGQEIGQDPIHGYIPTTPSDLVSPPGELFFPKFSRLFEYSNGYLQLHTFSRDRSCARICELQICEMKINESLVFQKSIVNEFEI